MLHMAVVPVRAPSGLPRGSVRIVRNGAVVLARQDVTTEPPAAQRCSGPSSGGAMVSGTSKPLVIHTDGLMERRWEGIGTCLDRPADPGPQPGRRDRRHGPGHGAAVNPTRYFRVLGQFPQTTAKSPPVLTLPAVKNGAPVPPGCRSPPRPRHVSGCGSPLAARKGRSGAWRGRLIRYRSIACRKVILRPQEQNGQGDEEGVAMRRECVTGSR